MFLLIIQIRSKGKEYKECKHTTSILVLLSISAATCFEITLTLFESKNCNSALFSFI